MNNFLQKLIKFGIGFILFIPLYVGGSFFFPFIFPKIWLFQLIIEIIFFFYVVLAISDSRFRPKFNLVLGATLLLTLILIITSFTGVDAFRSFWGNTERMSGVIAWFHFVAFAIILSSVLKTEKEWRKFFGIAAVVSILDFFYVLAQYVGASWAWLPHSQVGTIGNGDLLGSYAIFGAFFALYLWRNNTNNTNEKMRMTRITDNYNWLWASAFFINILTLYFAGSRGAMLGFLSGMLIYVAISVLKNKETRKVWAAIIIVAILAYGIIWMARGTKFVESSYQLSRITNISLEDRTIQQRFTEWGIAWDAFKTRPIFGFGPNNYLYLHNAFLNPRVYNLQETNFDRAHNAYLDYASMSGIIGLLGYVFLIVALFWRFFKSKLWIFASLVAAYAVQSFFVFDSPASYIVLFLTIGFAMFVENTELGTKNLELGNKAFVQSSKLQAPSSKLKAQSSSPQIIAAISIFYFLFSIFLIWQVSIKPAIANYKFTSAFSGLNADVITAEGAFNLYKEALKNETLGASEFRNQYINWLQQNLNKFKPENRLEVLDFGISELEKEVKDHPIVFSYLNLGQLYSYKARGIQDEAAKKGFFIKTAEAYDKALELSPKRLEVFYSYLQLALETKDYDKGIEIMKRAVEAAPNYPTTRWYLGFAYVASGNDTEAIKNINKALTLWYRNDVFEENGRLKYDLDKILKIKFSFAPKQEILGAVNPYIRQEMWPELLLLYLSAEAGDPNDIQIHQSLALVYQNLGLIDKVNEELRIVETLQKKQ